MSCAEKLQSLLGPVFGMYVSAQLGHWNVIGPGFHQFHEFFGEIYDDVQGSIDPLAENIRKLGGLVSVPTGIPIVFSSPDPASILHGLLGLNSKIISLYSEAIAHILEEPKSQGLVNFLAERLDAHQKWDWQMKSSVGIAFREANKPYRSASEEIYEDTFVFSLLESKSNPEKSSIEKEILDLLNKHERISTKIEKERKNIQSSGLFNDNKARELSDQWNDSYNALQRKILDAMENDHLVSHNFDSKTREKIFKLGIQKKGGALNELFK